MRIIDAEAIIRELQDEEQYGADYYLPIELLKSAPAIDAKPVVHAHWERKNNEMKCSNCEFAYYSNHDYFSFCPNCGATMDERKGEKE